MANENLRGQPLPLYIEDAVQEVKTTTAGVSAEYGRFAGGVINAITKSGGNTFSGSLRATLVNNAWRGVSPFGEPRLNRTFLTEEFTLGGPGWKDRLWFFTAGRFSKPSESRQLAFTGVPYEYSANEKRFEGKATVSVRQGHNLRVSYQKLSLKEVNASYGPMMDLRSLDDRNEPQDVFSVNYTAVLGSIFVEAQGSGRRQTLYGGSQSTDLIQGTQIRDMSRGMMRYWSPSLCAVCSPDERSNRDFFVKAAYFMSTARAGTHNVVLGFDTFEDRWNADNHKTGSDWLITGSGAKIVEGTDTIYPVFRSDRTTTISWNPILQPSSGNNFRTNSLFFNDQWQYGRFGFNLGIRWDQNEGRDSSGTLVARGTTWSPRLSISRDLIGDGQWVATASFARYVASISNQIANSASTAGAPASFSWSYTGPPVNMAPPYLSPEQALPIVFEWFEKNGIAGTPPIGATIPGLDTRIASNLRPPSTTEFVVGLSRAFGSRGTLRADLVNRRPRDFYSARLDPSTGQVIDPSTGKTSDLTVIENTNDASRRYWALQLQGDFRASTVTVGGNWTLSSLRGNFDGESAGTGPMTATLRSYPEYKDAAWNEPEGYLWADQRHKVRARMTWVPPFPAALGSLDVSVFEQVATGTPFGAMGSIDRRPYVDNPGYATPQGGTSVNYYFAARDSFRTETSWRTDLAVNYGRSLLRSVEFFVQGQVLNLFNQFSVQNVNYVNRTVYTARNDPRAYAAFNAFAVQPIEGIHWAYGPDFGAATDARAYTQPRTFYFSAGLRF